MEIAEHLDALRRHGGLMAEAAQRAGLSAPVPPCPPWLVRDLLRHTGYVHRWAARHLTERPAAVLDGLPEDEILAGGPADAGLLAWFLAGHAALVQAIGAADPALDCATFMAAPSPLAFWARRQAHETAIHRADAESAAGATPGFPADFAEDGIDELIMGFGRRRKYQPPAGGPGGCLLVRASDTGAAWAVDAHQGRMAPRREAGGIAADAACTVSGPASGLYLFLWNRLDAGPAGVTVSGDPGLLRSWQSALRVRWT